MSSLGDDINTNDKKAPYVLLIGPDSKEVDIYSELVKEVVEDCKIDVMSRPGSSFEWLSGSNYHLVIIDFSILPGGTEKLDGMAFLERVKRANPQTSVILISSQGTVEQAVRAIRMGAEDYFKKPFNLENFKLAVKRGLDRKAVFEHATGASDYLTLLNSCQLISASLNHKKIFSIVQSYFRQELQSNYTAIYTFHGKDSIRAEETLQDQRPDQAMEEILDIAICAINPFPKMVESNEFYQFVDRGQLTPGVFVFRFRCATPGDFFCVCLSPTRPTDVEAFETRLRILKSQIEATGANIKQYIGVQNLVFRDDATGLYNTRYLHNVLDREVAQAKVSRRSFAILFVDADHFKRVNDTHGHLVGTKLLNELGAHLKQLVRDSDTVFRYGGMNLLRSCHLAI